jgi:hypothetical protein
VQSHPVFRYNDSLLSVAGIQVRMVDQEDLRTGV